MSRKYVVISVLFLAFLVLSLLCYGSYRYAEQQTEKKRQATLVKETGQKKEQKVTSDTRYILEKYDEESEELVKEERSVPAEYAGLTRKELEHQLAVEFATMSYEEEKAGLLSISLESFSEDQIVIKKIYNGSDDQGFLLRIENGEVMIYRQDGDEFYENTGILEDDLSDEDREKLQNGYTVESEKDLYSVLENFSS